MYLYVGLNLSRKTLAFTLSSPDITLTYFVDSFKFHVSHILRRMVFYIGTVCNGDPRHITLG